MKPFLKSKNRAIHGLVKRQIISKLPFHLVASRMALGIINTSESKPEIAALEAVVLRWTIDDITTSNHFKKHVGVIPMEFSSTEEYLRVFRVPLLEEVRAQLHQALDKIISLQRAGHVMRTKIRKIVELAQARRDKSSKKLLDLHLESNARVKTSDLILLCSAKPRCDAKRECLVKSDNMFVLACVAHANEDSPMISATVYVQDGSPILEKLTSSTAWHVVLPEVSLTPARRIWNAISKPFAADKVTQMSVMHTILRIDRQAFPTGINDSLLLPQMPKGAGTLRRVEDYSNSRGLNESQRDVLKSVLASLLAGDAKPHIRLVQGPPGTGKTAMLVTLISVLGCLQCRALISAPANAAVVEISKRMMSFFEVSKNEEMFSGFCSRSLQGSAKSGWRSKPCFPISLWNVVLLGSKERLEGAVKGTVLEKIFLHHRMLRLMDALSPTTGWKCCVQSVVMFLTNAPSEFEVQHAKANESNEKNLKSMPFKDCKSGATGEKSRTSRKEEKKKQHARNASFWSFARKSMVELQARMQKTSFVLASELPQCHIDMTTSNAMTNASNLMANLVNLMPSEAPVEAMSWFSTTATTDTPHENFSNLNLSNGSPLKIQQIKFLQAREALLEALKSGPGCSLFITKKQPQGHVPSYEWLKSTCLKNATLVFSTVSGAGSPQMARLTFECAIIDEASQLVEAETTIITRMKGLTQLILVGDHKQLPATVISKVAEMCGYGRSLFDRLQILQHGFRHMLDIQYRMKPEINRFPNFQFYESKVKDGPNVLSPEYGRRLNDASAFGAYAFLDCKRGAEVAHQKSWKNPKEVEVVTTLMAALGKVCAERNIEKLSVGVISPYKGQVEALTQSLRQSQVLYKALQVEVKTVDGFQGSERDVIIFSAVRANHSRKIGFVDDCRRLNVAITRARHRVWIVGNATTLSGGGKIWKKLVSDAKARKCFHVLKD